ncbi:1-deoxy-D-xylulose-5-phosphate reductoisomerase [Enterobacteriaceae endosymbiont of Neohaemonia nigricornis]|uniref:1-deoxy-D-xylulose-5-phosphate reductoisomerase n=1 Tax=Enterobacteriaceae endosymbiont of Neohaemonia nigricornis TaxID=2675792 RepID=UPI001449DC38|nr:1-deoxy-D-xylulose-5-phosphate reductoisomerase [Enterobacteriaceae endosymbiont of Neohaemonia nigricornis]QJC30422.1 1-deoxy-D-xylulose-5-phosphate reductoisomerase [Enterobacteriaceae endosymbiont of Neohaemonia nigricornis]
MKYITILGSTGYIGRHILSVMLTNPNFFKIKALVAMHNVELMTKQCILFNPDYAVMYKKNNAMLLQHNLYNTGVKTKVLFGKRKIEEIVALDDVDQVIITFKNFISLLYILKAIQSGKIIFLTSIELLVITYVILIKQIYKFKSKILPINKNHSAIFEMMPNYIQNRLGLCDLYKSDVYSVILTGSGGPFLYLPIEKFKYINIKSCISSNVIDKKNIINTATMMLQGLEYIATKYLLNAQHKQIEIIINPESVIAAMVRFKDSSINIKINYPDIQTIITNMIMWPYKISTNIKHINFYDIQSLTFLKPDFIKYPCLKLAIETCHTEFSTFLVLNAANDIAVELCLKNKISFTDIAILNTTILNKLSFNNPNCIQEVLWIDNYVRKYTHYFVKKKFHGI